ncbi:Rrf2 family transcriptional regulator [Oscillospiraceae bacterium MB08-C2-2]|nr:Rrf2 family transcriptional regulator [Oscillospiraceae bacterium MB08-C2-2]
MHISLETDYAVRIVDCLARSGQRMGAKAISEKTCVTLRFSLKILRKLVASGIVCSFKGARGGYEIGKELNQISIHDIFETIEGPYILNRCMLSEHCCTRVPDKECPYHNLYETLSLEMRAKLKAVTMADIMAIYAGRAEQKALR